MNAAAAKIQSKAQIMLRQCSIKQLCDQWEETNRLKLTIAVAQVRGWLQDELESRDAVKHDAWIMTEDVDKMDHPAKFFLSK